MKPTRIAVTLVLLSSCARPSALLVMATATYPFHAEGRNVRQEIVESLDGVAYVFPNEVLVVVTHGFAALETTAEQQPIGLSAGLAYRPAGGGWDFRRESTEVPIYRIQHRGDTLAAPVEFLIRGTAGLALAEHWLVIQQHQRVLLPGSSQWADATRPIDSDADVFRRPATER